VNDLDLIERLRAAGTQGPVPRTSPDAVLAAGRRAQKRRNVLRVSGATLSIAAVVAAGMQLTPGQGTQTVTAAGDGAPGDVKPAPRSVGQLDPGADALNARILQAAMGNDFDIADDTPAGSLIAGTKSAAGLPTAYSGSVSLSTMVSNAAGLKAFCTPKSEKGFVTEGCVTRTLPDGRVVQANFDHWGPTEAYPLQTAGQGVRVLFLQPNGVLVWVDLNASTDAQDSSDFSGAAARSWLDSMVDRLGTAAADPKVEAQGFDGDHCTAVDDTEWNCDVPGAEPAPADEKAVAAKKAAEAKAMDARKAEAAKDAVAPEAAPADEKAMAAKKAAAAQDAAAPAPADEKAIAAKKAAAAEVADMDANKAAAAKECAAEGTC
jgi:hypothetical protein